jgi:dihydropteroate synthase
MRQTIKKKQLIGIVNCTPDSYFEGGRFTDPEEATAYGLRLIEEGADILDIGGESTRPGSDAIVSEEEEIRRVLPVITFLRKKTDLPLSIDTFKPKVAEVALHAGVDWINDITGFSHPRMRELAVEFRVKCCVMHMYGSPHTEPTPHYPDGIVEALLQFFQKRVNLLLQSGIEPSQIVLDPGIGGGAFGKSPEQCLQILKSLKRFTCGEYPILIGLSRKSFMQKILRKSPSEVLSTTLALNTMALLEGAIYIRVHDVAAHRDIFTIFERLDIL